MSSSSSLSGESAINREIRELAEREEQWRTEKATSEIDTMSIASSMDDSAFLDNSDAALSPRSVTTSPSPRNVASPTPPATKTEATHVDVKTNGASHHYNHHHNSGSTGSSTPTSPASTLSRSSSKELNTASSSPLRVVSPEPVTRVKSPDNNSSRPKVAPFQVVSGKSNLHTIMEKEMREAAKREEEWRKARLSNGSPSVHINGTKSPEKANKEPEVSPVKPKSNGDVTHMKETTPAIGTKVVKSNDASVLISAKESADFKKNAVVNANRVKRRKSSLALMWEAKNQ